MFRTGKHLSAHSMARPKQIQAVLFWFCLLAVGCTYAEDQFEEVGAANSRVLAAYIYMDGYCGTSHQLTIPIFAPARSEDVDLCIMQILSTDCATWGSQNNLPGACLAVSIQL